MGFAEAVKSVFSNYATFSGRARRSEFWFWALFTAVVGIVLGGLSSATGGVTVDMNTGATSYGPTYVITTLVQLALLLPTLAVTVRRLHDTNRSGFFWFLNFVPFVGLIIVLVFCVGDSTPGQNRFGANPKELTAPKQPTAV